LQKDKVASQALVLGASEEINEQDRIASEYLIDAANI